MNNISVYITEGFKLCVVLALGFGLYIATPADDEVANAGAKQVIVKR
ncbi:hypothetical protein [Ancylobacter rudongensis]|uniref:Uncharacterized protein n=1 Tax=Ancylobacter rudongensis TaxID=177413 RepID=A0A1G4UP65_9HYPH|nr:hypothetical protein [Ancylobacter rudongensis]SCW95451.1 hypothetical protein SAMN05660859_0031 [Ancylobacter rudongensis]